MFSVEGGREGLELFKATNKLIGEPCSPFSTKVHSGSAGLRVAGTMACLLERLAPLWASWVREVRLCSRFFLAPGPSGGRL